MLNSEKCRQLELKNPSPVPWKSQYHENWSCIFKNVQSCYVKPHITYLIGKMSGTEPPVKEYGNQDTKNVDVLMKLKCYGKDFLKSLGVLLVGKPHTFELLY